MLSNFGIQFDFLLFKFHDVYDGNLISLGLKSRLLLYLFFLSFSVRKMVYGFTRLIVNDSLNVLMNSDKLLEVLL